ncbi:putative AAA+ superfamily ATPase [Olsenella profusa DSM 13989]|uniref:AAA domain protein n=1 Tax=Olsenella profusa F0195 TaxID=1125712 RepID=U2V083_9ACTN|nr:ATP-binding protein [Olsenella profusa]ERL06096.1 AAA domain protein [Olsenella profusa F0195]MDP9859357.1 putative AAA+ superfamily ATPase [Olsenella profusa DSM 13989]
MEIRRDKYLNDLVVRKGNGMIKIVTGIRRCGKTYLVFDLFVRHLIESGVSEDHIITLALDDRANARYRDVDALYDYLMERIGNDRGVYYILLDEIQYAITAKELRSKDEPPALYGVLNGLLHRRNVDVYVTGSNSKLLSTDVMTEFRGRGDEVRIHPLTFAEFMQAFDGDRQEGWAEYVMYGGLPLVLSMRTPEQKAVYLASLFDEAYLSDVVERNHLTKSQELEDLVDVLASSIGALTNPSKIEATFRSELRSKLDADTIRRYLGHLEEAFLVSEATRYDVKGRRYIGTPKKYYFEDMGLRNARLGFRQVEESHIMENVIYNELRARGFSVDVGVVDRRMKNNGRDERCRYEVDFVANLGYRRYYIQSALQLDTPEKVAQEKRSLTLIDDSFRKIVVVNRVMRPYMDDDGILTMGLFDFLLDPNSLD